jgi:hypothetical protein
VQRCTPRFDHVITQARVNEQLAKKHLLSYKGRDLLNLKTTTLFESLREFKRLHVHWALAPAPDQDSDFKEGLDSAGAIFSKAVETITVFAALNVVYEMAEGQNRSQAAAELIGKKKAVIPPSLLNLLQQIMDNKSDKTVADKQKAAKAVK